MHLHLPPTMNKVIIAAATILALLIHAPTSLCVVDAQFVDCSTTFNCGSFAGIAYPFWTAKRPKLCGFPGAEFQLVCSETAAEITITNQTYQLLQIHNDDKALTVARKDYPASLCLTTSSTLNFTVFNYTSDSANLTLFSGCTDLSSDRYDLDSAEVNCGDGGYGYYATAAANGVYDYLGGAGCTKRVVVPYNQSSIPKTDVGVLTAANIIAAVENGFGVSWYARNEACDACARSGGACGHQITSGNFACYCADRAYSRTCGGNAAYTWKFKLLIGAIASAVAIFFSCIIMICIRKGTSPFTSMVFPRKLAKQDQNVEAFIRNHGLLAPLRHNYSQVRRITNRFKYKLGEGGFGAVYKGKLPNGNLVAVKVLKSSKGNDEEFTNEVASISRTSHVNIVSLLGYCFEGRKKVLIYEFMPNGSLEKYIFTKDTIVAPGFHLDWEKLYQIATGIARGLEYLHRGCNTRILHFDIKPHNILLDQEFCPKIADFGLAKLCLGKESVISMLGARGTIGYIAPELCCRNFGGVSHKSDVYSYGMMILEMVGGRKNLHVGSNTSEIYFPDWIYNQLEQGKDVELHGVFSGEDNAVARKMILVGLWCIQTNPSDRPSMSKVIEMLEGSAGTLQIPPKPSLSSPARAAMDSSTTSSQEISISVL